jgi:hypothetical protein
VAFDGSWSTLELGIVALVAMVLLMACLAMGHGLDDYPPHLRG